MSDQNAREVREREIKFAVSDEWTLPDPSALAPVGGTVEAATVELESRYLDTEAHDLLANRLTLRRRSGTTDQGWQLKLPAGVARTELHLPLTGNAAPREFQQLTLGLRHGAPLRPVAIIRTRRDLHTIMDAAGTPLAELAIDAVTAERLGAELVTMTWREVEVELKQGDEALLRKVSKWLRQSGASPSPSESKLARTLEAPARTEPRRPNTINQSVRRYLDEQYDVIRAGDLALRRDQEAMRDTDAIHQTRVATRRYRSALRVFAKRLDRDRAAALDAELKWYAAALGEVRDLEVLRTNLLADLAELPRALVLGPVSARLSETLGKQIAQARRQLATVMRSKRYLALMTELQAWSTEPPITAKDEAASHLDRYVRKTEKKYAQRLTAAELLDDTDPAKNNAMHQARKAAKRARYTAELSVPALGKRARKAVKRAKKLQTRLGQRQDAVVAVGFLRRLGATAGTTPGENGFTFGVLLGRELRRGHLRRA